VAAGPETALERDDYQCVICGATRAELGRNPDVHHHPGQGVRSASGDDRRNAHYLENLVSLCIDCHRKAEFGHISRERLRESV
jgi:5-methylcytosine-specific restriction endonuclease McrA